MSETPKSGTLKINPLVALEEAAHLVEFYRNRALVNAQGRYDLAQKVGDLQARVDTFIAEAEAASPAVVEPVKKKA